MKDRLLIVQSRKDIITDEVADRRAPVDLGDALRTERLVPGLVCKRIDDDLRPDGGRPEFNLDGIFLRHLDQLPECRVDRLTEVTLELVVELRRLRDLRAEESAAQTLGTLGRQRHEQEVFDPFANGLLPAFGVRHRIRHLRHRLLQLAEEPTRDETIEVLFGDKVAVHERRIRAGLLADLARRSKLEALLGEFFFRRLQDRLTRLLSINSFLAHFLLLPSSGVPVFVSARIL